MKQRGMLSSGQFNVFMSRYFPIFAVGYLLCMMAIAIPATVWGTAYLRMDAGNAHYDLIVMMALCLVLCTGQFLMIRGLRWGLWLMVASLGPPLVMALSLFDTRTGPVWRLVALLLPLLALLVLNSRRYRAMSQRLIELRLQRAGLLPEREGDDPDGRSQSSRFMVVLLIVSAVLVVAKLYLWVA